MSNETEKRKETIQRASRDPGYRPPQYERISDLVAGRTQAGPPPTPPRDGADLDRWQDLDWFHSPEL